MPGDPVLVLRTSLGSCMIGPSGSQKKAGSSPWPWCNLVFEGVLRLLPVSIFKVMSAQALPHSILQQEATTQGRGRPWVLELPFVSQR